MTLSSFFVKTYTTFCVGFGAYGASRSIRADTSNDKITIIRNAIVNGMYYTYPVINFIPLTRLYNRIYIEKNGINILYYPMLHNYLEVSGYCFETY